MAEGKLSKIKPRLFFLQFQGVLPHSRGVSHLETVTPLNALREAVENFFDQYHVFLVHPIGPTQCS